ncbi:hypothetical protein MES5069_100039 [Mesorhizobium escarrei]|uniref:Uncharacterized protein n=1 Tax=Mesorhizobium escarrei TaxID=666018 RepID=A0ABN8JDF9_9HYPH|nr:hypothetical protein MES5069_100039 [Mesorhizobium escarrei]
MRTSKGSAGSGAPNEGFLDAPADNDVIEKLKHKLACPVSGKARRAEHHELEPVDRPREASGGKVSPNRRAQGGREIRQACEDGCSRWRRPE